MPNTDSTTAGQHRHGQQRSRSRRAVSRVVGTVGWGVPNDVVHENYHIIGPMFAIPLLKAGVSIPGNSESLMTLLTIPHAVLALAMFTSALESDALVPTWPDVAVMLYGVFAAAAPAVVAGLDIVGVSVTAQGVRGFLCGLAFIWVTAAALRGGQR